MRPLVGITAWRRRLDTYLGRELLHTLAVFYVDAVTEADMTPLILPAAQDPSAAARLVELVDGLVISGGDDVDPASYGAEPTTSSGHSPEVDRFEIALVHEARSQNKPLLAICRGLQLLNVALGGTLLQEVTAAGAVHELIDDSTDIEKLSNREHVVRFHPKAMLAGLYGGKETKVNTLHHQGVDRLSPDLIVEGTTADGLVEAARYRGGWWALGVQWHPERMEGHHRVVFEALRHAILTEHLPPPLG